MAERSLEGWAPVIGRDATLEDVVEAAFDYRGDVTIVCHDGRRLVGYVFNRDRRAPEPYLELLEPSGAVQRLRYAEVAQIAFTGKDAAAGRSWEAWRHRRAEAEAAGA